MESNVKALKRVEVITDGACKGNPGPGGWGVLLRLGRHEKEMSGHDHATTNNRMEMTAVLRALNALIEPCDVVFHTDSRYVIDGMTKWIHGWKRRGWKTAAGDPVKNQDLVMALEAEIERHSHVRWHWVKGHETGAQHAHKVLNDRADRLAVAAAQAAAARRAAA